MVKLDCGSERKIAKLTYEYGVYDNWPILLNGSFEELTGFIDGSGCELDSTNNYSGTNLCNFYNSMPGEVGLQVMNYVPNFCITGSSKNTERIRLHVERQKRDFHMSMMLHPYQTGDLWGLEAMRRISELICSIGYYALKSGNGLCFPDSRGWKNLDDFSGIVYYYPPQHGQQ
jgi:hypothetical protein